MRKIILCLLVCSVLTAISSAASSRPNIIFILADDLGCESVGAYGGAEYKDLGPVRTPNLDVMAREGLLFSHCFAAPVCSPARAELLTGKYNFRTGFTDITGRNGAVSSLDARTHPTLAAQLKRAGYVTAVAGKWHMGPPESMAEVPLTAEADTNYPHPRECGFDRQCVFGGAHLKLYGDPKPDAYIPERMQQWVLRFLESRKDAAAPFFIYYASPIPHFPLHPTPLNPNGQRQDQKNFPYLVEYLDRQVGEVLRKLDALGLRENTLVFFAGDNGTDKKISTVMRDGRIIPGGKGSLLDTGSQAPLLASWPGVVPAGRRYEGLVDFTDIMPTCLGLAGAPAPEGMDGLSFAEPLRGKPGAAREWVHVFFLDKYFVRDARWKLRENGRLYDLKQAPYDEVFVDPAQDNAESGAARVRLKKVADRLHPAANFMK